MPYTQPRLLLLFCVTRPSLQYWEIGLVPATAAGCIPPQCNPIKMNSDHDQPLVHTVHFVMSLASM